MLEESGIDPEQLVIEITETQLLDDAAASVDRFRELRALGVRIALDDFGTGYSSLSYLHSLPLDTPQDRQAVRRRARRRRPRVRASSA